MQARSTRSSRWWRWAALAALLLPALAGAAMASRRRTPTAPVVPGPERPPATGHRPVSSPHAREIAQLNRRVIAEYEERHAGDDDGADLG